jgi:serine/threonine protein kinase
LYDDEGESFTLPVQSITSELQQEQSKYVPALMRQLGWPKSTKKLVYHWFINNPKTALLLWMADDVRAWPAANLHGLNDQMLPYSTTDLEGIADDPEYVAELQWKVAHKQLLRDRKHTEFVVKETVPLATVRGFSSELGTLKSKRLDFVKFCDGTTPLVYFRKRLDLRDYADKQAILSQIQEYHRLSHPHIAEIVGSYARGQTIAFLTPRADSSLDEYLETFTGTSEAEQLLAWMRALASALCYLHELRPAVTHRSLRPQKILVYHSPSPSGSHGGNSGGGSGGGGSSGNGGNGGGSSSGGPGAGTGPSTVRLAVFGIARPARSTAAQLFQPYSTDAAYVYAAPETVARRGGGQEGAGAAAAADVFALGAVFLEMACAARGVRVARLAAARQAASHDPSFHANLDRVDEWFALLAPPPQANPPPPSVSRRERRAAAIGRVLPVIRSMLAAEPEARPDMKFVLSCFDQGSPRARPLRRSGLNVGRELLRDRMAMGSNVWGELEALNGYYDPPHASSSSGRFGGETQGEGRGSWRW